MTDKPLAISEVTALSRQMLDEIERAIVGKRDVLELVLYAVLADGHVLIEDVPGLAKTLLARSFAQVAQLDFRRIQFTPDLMPADVTGAEIYNQRLGDFEFRPGPIFTNFLLADEINRAPAKTQAALLEAMQERQVSTEGVTRRLSSPFIVMATQNPIEYEGTYPLPEAQLDRFLVRASVGYPTHEAEIEILQRRIDRRVDDIELSPVVDRDLLVSMQRSVERVFVSPSLLSYMVDVVRATRDSRRVQIGASPRGALALLKLARSRAVVSGRDYVTPEDIKGVAIGGLSHRIVLRPELWVQRIRPEEVVRECLDEVPVPATVDPAAVTR